MLAEMDVLPDSHSALPFTSRPSIRTSGLMMSFLWCAPMQKGKPRGFMWGGFGGAMFPLRRLRGQLVNNDSTGEVCLLGRSHPFICATHYHSLRPPLSQTRLSVCTIVRVCFTKPFHISHWPCFARTGAQKLDTWLRLSRADRGFSVFLFGDVREEWIYLDNLCHFL